MKHHTIFVRCTIAVIVLALVAWVSSRWTVWFGNPPEPAYIVSSGPDRLLLTFGDEGESSRYVTWLCDTVVDPEARLLLTVADTLAETDTMAVKAVGEVFESRAGKAAYYRAHLTNLPANSTLSYAVESNGSLSEWHQFKTGNPASDCFSFLYVGDVQDTIGGIANTLLRKAVDCHPEVEFIAFGGDLVERPMDKYWAETFRGLDGLCTTMPVVNVTGNHDYLKYIIRKCERRFSLVFPYFIKGMDERGDQNHLFAFRYHNTDFFLLDTDRGLWFLNQQRKWLKTQLQASSSAHRIALLHHPLYSVKSKFNNLEVRWMFNDLIREADVELVLQGHEHAYAHCTSDEQPLAINHCESTPLYVVSHCSPKNYKINPSSRFSSVQRKGRYYQVVRVDGSSVTLLAYDAISGIQVDSVRVINNKL